MDGDGVQPVIKVLAETAFLDGQRQVDVGSSYDSDVGLHHLGATYADEFAVFEHTKQSCLGREGQLTDLVQEEGAFVGNLEVTFALAHGTSESAFLVAEEFRVDGAFGDGTAVHGKVLAVLTRAVLVDDLRKHVLTRAALARDEHGEVGGGHLCCDADGAVQLRVGADDAEGPFYCLYVHNNQLFSCSVIQLFSCPI